MRPRRHFKKAGAAAPRPAPGSRVKIRDEEWMVTKFENLGVDGKALGNEYVVHAIGLSELVRDHESIFLSTLDDIQLLKPEATTLVADESSQYRRARLYLEALLRHSPPIEPAIHLGHRGALEAMPYQLEPAHMALNALRPRILIADAVGLGKTLEAGILLTELIRRGRGRRILVVVVKSMLLQFQQELWSRFTIPLVRLDSVGIQRLQKKIPSQKNPFSVFDKVIVSIDTLKNDGRYRTFLESVHWDAVVLDECHHVANRGSQRSRLAELLAARSEALILTSATPHNGRPASFAHLMEMLDPTAIADPDEYRAEDIQGLFVRRFKKDVAQDAGQSFSPREVQIRRVSTRPEETELLEHLQSLRFSTLDKVGQGRRPDALFRTTLMKAFLSSPEACLETVENRRRRVEKTLEADPNPKLRDDSGKLGLLATTLKVLNRAPSSKLEALAELLKAKGFTKKKGPRVLIFSERRRTLARLQEFLAKTFDLKPEEAPVFHAGLSDLEQQRIVESFGLEKSPIRILIANDVASEGINLHYHCHHLVHFDVPWSLITLEQRNGRIDRFGQTQTPKIEYLTWTTPEASPVQADLRVLDVLIEKEKAAHENLGDAAELLKCYDAKAEEDTLTQAFDRGATDAVESVLFGGEPPSADPSADEDFDFFALCQAAGANPEPQADPIRELPRLFGTDLEFVRAALEHLDPEAKELRPDYHPQRPSLYLPTPEGMRGRIEFLPPEALPQKTKRAHEGETWYLSEDRQEILDAIAEARKKGEDGHAAWPRAQLLWEHHPLVQWLTDRVLQNFERHEAPVLGTPGLAEGTTWTLFQGQISNARGLPVLVEWFAVPNHPEAPIQNLAQVFAAVDLGAGSANRGLPEARINEAQLELKQVVERARGYLSEKRTLRGREKREELAHYEQKFKDWAERAKERARKKQNPQGLRRDQIPRDRLEKLEQRIHSIEQREASQTEWLKKSFRTEDNPYLVVAAVFVGTGSPPSNPPTHPKAEV